MDGWMDGWMDHCKPKVLKLRVKNTKPMGHKLNVFFLSVSTQKYSMWVFKDTQNILTLSSSVILKRSVFVLSQTE